MLYPTLTSEKLTATEDVTKFIQLQKEKLQNDRPHGAPWSLLPSPRWLSQPGSGGSAVAAHSQNPYHCIAGTVGHITIHTMIRTILFTHKKTQHCLSITIPQILASIRRRMPEGSSNTLPHNDCYASIWLQKMYEVILPSASKQTT